MEAVGIPCRNKCVCYKMSANYRKRPIFSVMDNGQLWKLLQNENTIAIVQKQKSGNFFELLWFKKVSGFSVMLFEEPFCNSQSHFYEKKVNLLVYRDRNQVKDNVRFLHSAQAGYIPRACYISSQSSSARCAGVLPYSSSMTMQSMERMVPSSNRASTRLMSML